MKDDIETTTPESREIHSHALKNDGPDETPVYEDLYHDEGRRNILEEEAEEQNATKIKQPGR